MSSYDPKPPVYGYPASSTAQPYPNPYPPQQPYYPQQPYPNPNYNHYPDPAVDTRRRRFFRSFIFGIIAVFIVIGLISLITFLVLRPKVPTFAVTSFSASSFNLSSSALSSTFDVKLEVTNPNSKLSANYYSLKSAVFYEDDNLASTALPPFYQSTGQVDVVPVKFSVVGYVEGDSLKGMEREKASGEIEFDVRMVSWVSFRSGSWRVRTRRMDVLCKNVRTKFAGANADKGESTGGRVPCVVYV